MYRGLDPAAGLIILVIAVLAVILIMAGLPKSSVGTQILEGNQAILPPGEQLAFDIPSGKIYGGTVVNLGDSRVQVSCFLYNETRTVTQCEDFGVSLFYNIKVCPHTRGSFLVSWTWGIGVR